MQDYKYSLSLPPIFSPPSPSEQSDHYCPMCGQNEAQRQYAWREYICEYNRTPYQVWIVKDAMSCTSCGAIFAANFRTALYDPYDDELIFQYGDEAVGWNSGIVVVFEFLSEGEKIQDVE